MSKGLLFHWLERAKPNHLPQSTLLILVSALTGQDQLMAAYTEAIQQNGRF